MRGGSPPWQTKAGFLRPSSAPAWVFTVSLPAEPALSPGCRPPRHRATAPHAHLPHRHLHPLQERQAHQVGARLLRGSARALLGMGCWLKAMGGGGALASKQASCVGVTLPHVPISHRASRVNPAQPSPSLSRLFGGCHSASSLCQFVCISPS